jgi:transcriptional regulator with XRE-family HTH domain
MEKKTIGSFMSALRKTNGFTQQEVADKLNVSNKTVSKWERDESSPDISLIPVIAELYGVTCDEILLGERSSADNSSPNKSVKVEKQIKHLTVSLVLKFKNMSFISILLAMIGLILVFSVSYAFFTPIIGFSLSIICIAVSVALIAVQFNTIINNLSNNVLNYDVENADNSILHLAMTQIYRWFFAVLSINIFVLLLSMPFLIRDANLPKSVILFRTYLVCFPVAVAVSLILIFCLFYFMRSKLSLAHINDWLFYHTAFSRKMNFIQLAFMAGAVFIILIIQLNIKTPNMALGPLFTIIPFFILILCLIITMIVHAVKEKDKRKRFFLAVLGSKNFLLGASVFIALGGLTSVSVYDGNTNLTSSYHLYNFNMLGIALLILVATFVVYLVTKYRVVKAISNNSQ